MLRLLVPLIIFGVFASPAFAEFNTVSCNVNNILSAYKGKITGSFADTINIIRDQQ